MPTGLTRILPFAAISAALHAAVLMNTPERLEIAVTPRGDTGPVAVRLVPAGATTPDPAAQSGVAGSIPDPAATRERESAPTAATDRVRTDIASADTGRNRSESAETGAETADTDQSPPPKESRMPPDAVENSSRTVATAPSEASERGDQPEDPAAPDAAKRAVEPETRKSTRIDDTKVTDTVVTRPEAEASAPEPDTSPDADDARPAREKSGAAGANDRAQLASRARERVQVHFRERFRYPRIARQRGWEGRVVLEFNIQPDGRITDVDVVESSGRSILDENARQTLIHIQRVPELADRMGRTPLELVVPVTYRLQPA